MGVRPYKAFTFDGESSLTYGVYLTGEGVFNAPERAVEMLDIPGRNGSFALDQGRFQNISVTYKAGMVDDSESDFATRLADFRSWICSKVGYCRLEDDYNTGEYRMAVYMSGLEVDHDDLQTGEFDITFSCKPQRFLTSGETAITVTSGNAITNPTPFDARPMLEAYGFGKININGGEIELSSGGVPVGEMLLVNQRNYYKSSSATVNFIPYFMSGDPIYSLTNSGFGTCVVSVYTDSTNGWLFDDDRWHIGFKFEPMSKSNTFVANTAQTYTKTATTTVNLYNESDPDTFVSATITVTFVVAYDGDESISFTIQNVAFGGAGGSHLILKGESSIYVNDIYVDSSASALGNPTYIDLDVGEAYNMDFGYAVSVNNAVSIPAELPVLPSGNTVITFDNTITKLDLIPRWWKV